MSASFHPRNEHGEYHTTDGRFYVARQIDEVPCLDPHPCRVSKGHRAAIRKALAEHNYRAYDVIRYARVTDEHGIAPDQEAIHAVADGKKGYFCPGDELHAQWHWYAWDIEKDDYAGGGGVHDFDTKKEAVAYLNKYVYGDPYAEMREAMTRGA